MEGDADHFVISLPSHCLFFIFISSADLLHSGGTVYTVNWEDQEQESSSPSILQSLRLFMFLQHNDQFACQLSDRMGEEQLH